MKIEHGFECDVPEDDFQQFDSQTLYCGKCEKNVHNISEMNRADAADFLRGKYEAGEEVCIRQVCIDDETSFADDPDRRLERQRDGVRHLIWAAAVAIPMLLLTPAEASHELLVHSPVGWALNLEHQSPDGKILGVHLKDALLKSSSVEEKFQQSNQVVITGDLMF